ncbi:MAG: VWA domain-containing protein [Candidatus Omnitrophica bacterium]|nr:VWA domain-containing protein [Candidatus Omnitrophota bacterium]
MTFVNTHFNYLFLAFFVLIVFLIVAAKQKAALLEAFADKRSLAWLVAKYSRKKDFLKAVLIVFAAFFVIVALLRPQWGFVWEEVEHKGVDVMIAVDVSRSMMTKDVLPSRLERTKLALEDLVGQLQGDRIGLIAFAGSAFVQCPLTIDYNGFLLAVRDLNESLIPKAGTNIENAIIEAMQSFGKGSEGADRTLVIITDGESHVGDALKVAAKAKQESIKIHTIGVGTTQGELIEIKDEEGKLSYIKDQRGQIVKSRLNEKALQEIALSSGGIYIKSTPREFGLERLYNSKIMDMEKRKMKSTIEKRRTDRFQLPLILAFLLLFIEPFISNQKNT